MSILKVGPPEFQPEAIVFDKDGTLIDFDAMWGVWVTELADRLEAATQQPLRDTVYQAMGYDAARGRVLAQGRLAVTPMQELRTLVLSILRTVGLPPSDAELALAAVWRAPDPVALARPFTHLPTLFRRLRSNGIKVAIATTDDREPTLATLAGLGVGEMVDAMVCADDGLAVKPAPDMVTAICSRLNTSAARAVVVGDSAADLQMGKRAGAGLVVGVLSGVSSHETLAPHADAIVESIARLI